MHLSKIALGLSAFFAAIGWLNILVWVYLSIQVMSLTNLLYLVLVLLLLAGVGWLAGDWCQRRWSIKRRVRL